MMKAKISEIFKSIQGEGIYQGRQQAFVRFFGCNLSCSFCDTHPHFYQEKTIDDVLDELLALGSVHSVSLTGGEPLTQIQFLETLARRLKTRGQTVYLETNGTLPQSLAKVIDYLDIIAMDFKLPSSTAAQPFWDEHREFLKVASAKEVFVKAVVGKRTKGVDILQTIKIVRGVGLDLPLVLAPEHPFEPSLREKIIFYKMLCRLHNIKVRVVSQLHKELGIR